MQSNYIMFNNSILIIDSDKDIRFSLEQQLLNEGYNVFTAELIEDTVEILKSHNIDLLIIDINLKNNISYEIIKLVKEKNYLVKCIISSSNISNKNIEYISEIADDFVIKPFDINDLLLRIMIQLKSKEKLDKQFETLNFNNTIKKNETLELNIFIVDDDIELTYILKTNFKSKYINVYTANSIAEAKIILQNKNINIDIAILDIFFPDSKTGGYEIIGKVRTNFPDSRIIVYTGTNIPDVEFTKYGVDIVFRKPMKPSVLMNNLNTFIRNKILENKLNYNLRIQSMLNDFSKKIKVLDLWDLRDEIKYYIKTIFAPDYYFLYILETYNNLLGYLYCHSHKNTNNELTKNLVSFKDDQLISVIKSGKPLIRVNEIYHQSKIMKNIVMRHYIIYPVKYIRRTTGVLFLGKINEIFSEEDFRLIETFADILSRQIEIINIHTREKELRMIAEQLSVTDTLTKIYNTRYFNIKFENEFKKSKSTNAPFSLLIIDIDFFKKFNDIYGHKTGDAVLEKIAEIIKINIRQDFDTVARYGGEEFCVILPGIAKEALTIIAERIRTNIENCKLQTNHGDLSITVSIGGTIFSNNFNSPKDMFKTADKALYQSKQTGRNKYTYLDI